MQAGEDVPGFGKRFRAGGIQLDRSAEFIHRGAEDAAISQGEAEVVMIGGLGAGV